jgi:hypothetical protein
VTEAAMAPARITDPKIMVGPLPSRLLSFPDIGPITIPTRYAKYMSVITSVGAANGGLERWKGR